MVGLQNCLRNEIHSCYSDYITIFRQVLQSTCFATVDRCDLFIKELQQPLLHFVNSNRIGFRFLALSFLVVEVMPFTSTLAVAVDANFMLFCFAGQGNLSSRRRLLL